MDEFERKLRRATHELKAAAVVAAGRRLLFVLRKASFDPNQPRVPAGSPDGGQWTDGNGAFSNGIGRLFRISDVPRQFHVDLWQEEGYLGGHTIAAHVAVPDGALIAPHTRKSSAKKSFEAA